MPVAANSKVLNAASLMFLLFLTSFYTFAAKSNLAALTAASVILYYLLSTDVFTWWKSSDSSTEDHPQALNERHFVPFDIVAREDVSPTAFVLTLQLASAKGPGTEPPETARRLTQKRIKSAWRHGLWSVEVKQPQLQIARDYTPLPEATEVNSEGDETRLRLFVRVVPGGEVSKFLSRQTVGSQIELRGPRRSFDVVTRLGEHAREGKLGESITDERKATDDQATKTEPKRMIVLAGGTGISTALQAANAALCASPTVSVSILWANRQSIDSTGLHSAPDTSQNKLNPIVRDIQALRSHYGADRLQVRSFVDAEQTHISGADVLQAMTTHTGNGGHGGNGLWYWAWWRRAAKSTVTPASSAAETIRPCIYHSNHMLERQDADPWRDSDGGDAACACAHGKNLVLVSGPDGFIEAWAGPKKWEAGKEWQGSLGGILGQMAARDPQMFSQWQVLKL
ncbi:mitochondrial peripheral inner membrane protein [Sporothrix epigloea]|uniref:Mitochondrial peripheral inner membrane protein n=1 Tax=Sporothrix epigloea TaxID=1892477 RepID=A0ABP0DUU1_9PEZI